MFILPCQINRTNHFSYTKTEPNAYTSQLQKTLFIIFFLSIINKKGNLTKHILLSPLITMHEWVVQYEHFYTIYSYFPPQNESWN